jgi:hypothetical protein
VTKLLFLHGDSEDYLADSLLHGLRTVLGADAVDAPRRDALYAGLPARERRELYGRGFTLYGRLPEVDVDREAPLERALAGEFGVVVIGDIHRNWAPWLALRPHLERLRAAGTTLAVCDGGDGPVLFPHGPTWWKRLRPLPRVAGRVPVFKRELSATTAVIRYRGLLPPGAAQRALAKTVRPIAFSIPEDLLARGDEAKTKLLAAHVVDPEVRTALDLGDGGYRFEEERDYHDDLRASRFGVTTKKAGWETLRHYEIAAAGCVPAFRDLASKPPLSAPFGLDETNSVAYSSAAELLERIESMGDEEYARRRAGALDWARRNTTRARALELLSALGHPR